MRRPDRERLSAATRQIPDDGLAVRELLSCVPGATVPWLIVMCTLPAALPGVQLGWVCVPLMLLLARSLAAGRQHARLPQRVAAVRISQANARRLLKSLAWTADFCERHCRRRALRLVRATRRGPAGLLVATMALIILIPFPGSNFLPAAAVVLLMGGVMWRDGYAVAAAWLAAIASIAMVGLIVVVGIDVARAVLPA